MKHVADQDQRDLYAEHRRGMLSSNLTETGGFVRTRPGLDAPDLEVLLGAFGLGGDDEQFTILCGGLQPHSTGRIVVADPDTAAPPHIQAGYLEHDADVQTLFRGVELAPSRRADRTGRPLPGAGGRAGRRGERTVELETFVRQTAVSFYHQVGTCAMGDGPLAVVDDRLAVHGLNGVWVADASVMPQIV